jgi:hypothetical protein
MKGGLGLWLTIGLGWLIVPGPATGLARTTSRLKQLQNINCVVSAALVQGYEVALVLWSAAKLRYADTGTSSE